MFIGGLETEIKIIFSRSRKMSWSNFTHWDRPYTLKSGNTKKSMQENNEMVPAQFSTRSELEMICISTSRPPMNNKVYWEQKPLSQTMWQNNTQYIPINFPNITFLIVKFSLGHSVQETDKNRQNEIRNDWQTDRTFFKRMWKSHMTTIGGV